MEQLNIAARNRELGAELRKQRESVGVTGAELAARVGWSPSKISRIEHGTRSVSAVELVQYLGHCGIFRVKALGLLDLCRSAELNLGYWLSPHGEWLEDSLSSLIYHESTAARSIMYEPLLVPGLMQTREYAHAMIATELWRTSEAVENCVQIRMVRQRILRMQHPARFAFFLHERALHQQVGNAAVMHEQLLKIVLLAAMDHITVRVIPDDASDQSRFGGSFRLFEYAEHRPLVYLDTFQTGLFMEDRQFVEPYRTLVSALSEIALREGQSRDMIAALASVYDQGSDRDARTDLEEEQP